MENSPILSDNRIIWIDYAKVFGLLLVILAHLYSSEGLDSSNVVRTYIYGFHMPFFFFISGMLFKERDCLKTALRRNVQSLLFPFLAFNFLFAIVYGLTDGHFFRLLLKIPTAIFQGKGNVCKASWFVICLFFIKCIYDIFSYYKIRSWGMIIVIIVSLIPIRPNYFFFSSTILGLVFYHLGFMSKRYLNISIPYWKCLLFALVFFIVSYFLTQWNGKVSLFGGKVGNNILLFYLNAIVGSSGIVFTALALRSKTCNLIIKASNASIGVLLLHMFFVDIAKMYNNLFSTGLFFYYFLVSLFIYSLCVSIYYLTLKLFPVIWGKL